MCSIRKSWACYEEWENVVVVDREYSFRLVAGAFFFLRQGEMRPLSEITAMAPTLEGGPMDWQYKTEPQSGFCEAMKDSRFIWPRSRVLGGTSTINGMLYVRGNRRDYDNWALAGSIGWSYDEVLPYFKKSEDMQVERYLNSSFHKTEGYLTVEEFRYRPKIVNTSRKIGYQNNDINGEKPTEFGLAYGTLRDGLRCSIAKAFLRPARNRLNFDISLHSFVEKILIDSNTKVTQGVVFKKNMHRHTVGVRKEVNVSAGAFNSPHLLVLSGIGSYWQILEAGI
uniref:Glucose-methanol-choline oxidoreductase N-terminal domain-containing protein n=1 Tax=Timema genevievae TaxID=629358 RepID=A0A7R9JT32_TIMGE|nr:unnamed protein product [Timema genevievae]